MNPSFGSFELCSIGTGRRVLYVGTLIQSADGILFGSYAACGRDRIAVDRMIAVFFRALLAVDDCFCCFRPMYPQARVLRSRAVSQGVLVCTAESNFDLDRKGGFAPCTDEGSAIRLRRTLPTGRRVAVLVLGVERAVLRSFDRAWGGRAARFVLMGRPYLVGLGSLSVRGNSGGSTLVSSSISSSLANSSSSVNNFSPGC